MQNPKKVYTKEQLYSLVWKDSLFCHNKRPSYDLDFIIEEPFTYIFTEKFSYSPPCSLYRFTYFPIGVQDTQNFSETSLRVCLSSTYWTTANFNSSVNNSFTIDFAPLSLALLSNFGGAVQGAGHLLDVGGVHLDDVPTHQSPFSPRWAAFPLPLPKTSSGYSAFGLPCCAASVSIRVWDYPSKQFFDLRAGGPLNQKSTSGYSLAVLVIVTLPSISPLY